MQSHLTGAARKHFTERSEWAVSRPSGGVVPDAVGQPCPHPPWGMFQELKAVSGEVSVRLGPLLMPDPGAGWLGRISKDVRSDPDGI